MSKRFTGPEKIGDHTIYKFVLVSNYAKEWAIKLLNYVECERIVFIDCMSNCGHYLDSNDNLVEGTGPRVAKTLSQLADKFPDKQIAAIFNDIDSKRIDYLKTLMPAEKTNFKIEYFSLDANELIKTLKFGRTTNYLLMYDPFEAAIDWEALEKYFNGWGEVIINHMISDSIRGAKMAKSKRAVGKYEQTYLSDLNELVPYGSDKKSYEKRIEGIIQYLKQRKNRKYYIASFPFFNEKNALVYDLIHCTNSFLGFNLFKKTAWRTFGGKSSSKNTKGKEDQLTLDFDGKGYCETASDENCYYIKDVVDYIQNNFDSQQDVPLDVVWELLDNHPVFPSDGYKKEIKQQLKERYQVAFHGSTVSFKHRG